VAEGLEERITGALTRGLPGSRVEDLGRATPGSRVGGTLVWDGFEGVDQLTRQRRVPEVLATRLRADDVRQISLILTVTEDELDGILAD